MATKSASLVPALLFVAALGGAFVWVVMREGKGPSSSASSSPPAAFAHCWASGLALDDAGSASLHVSPENASFVTVRLDGKVNVNVEHEVPESFDAGYVRYPTPPIDACSMTTSMKASDYDDAGVRLQGKLGSCALPPADRIVRVNVTLDLGDASSSSWCEYVGPVPAELGGKDLAFEDQRKAYFAGLAAREHPEALPKIREWITSLARVAMAIDPTVRPKVTPCAADVAGTVPVVSWETLSTIASPTLDGGKLRESVLVSQKVMFSYLTDGTPTPKMLVPGGWDLHPAEVAAKLEPLSRWVVVLTSLATVPPIVDIPEGMSGHVVEARFTPGTYHGGLWVVDRTTGKVACTAPVIAESSNSRMEATNPNDLSRSAQSDLARQVWTDLKARLATSAPGLVIESLSPTVAP